MTTVNAIAKPFSGLLAVSPATIAVITTVMGPVGSEISVGVPPNNAAKKPTITAPYRPPIGPTPDATPKARARGNETMAAVTPPKMSPRTLLKLIRLVIDMEQ